MRRIDGRKESAPYPGRPERLPQGKRSSRDEPMSAQESAEGIVVPSTGTKARTCRDGEDLNSMDGADADKHG